jgi:ketol-acid reductoisomerase
MNRIISDTAEYGCYLFDHACKPLLTDFMKTIDTNVIGKSFSTTNGIDNAVLIAVNKSIVNTQLKRQGVVERIHDSYEK